MEALLVEDLDFFFNRVIWNFATMTNKSRVCKWSQTIDTIDTLSVAMVVNNLGLPLWSPFCAINPT